ncbi:MAG: hypothetical protein H7A53_01400 [Akkermansiaceae bacterium]|nr:hypothetical protein [Akkermansiaceae bacterium]
MSPKDQLALLMRGTAQVISEKELLAKLERGKPLRAKLGVDPTSPDLHLGHSVALEKLRQFQELGHQAVLIIGDFSPDQDPRAGRRPVPSCPRRRPRQREPHRQASTSRPGQDGSPQRRMVPRHDLRRRIRLNARVTMQQVPSARIFKNRSPPKCLREISIPSQAGLIVVRSDVELGGTDQLFNIPVWPRSQRPRARNPQVVK